MSHPEPAPPAKRLMSPNHCSKCGTEFVADYAEGKLSEQCPQCLFDLALTGFDHGPTDGSDFGEYRLVHQVGRGAMGVVYEAVHVALGRTVALKMILEANLGQAGVRRRFKIEAEAAAKLDHPNIVPVYDFGEREGQAFLSMQFVAGENLKQKIRRGEFSLASGQGDAAVIAKFMAKVARAVVHAHEHGVLHRDLKPANILVDAEGQPHLTDFGLAKIVDEHPGAEGSATAPGGVLGTWLFMAPEQASKGISSVAGDIYGIGAVLYNMLTGRPPVAPGTMPQMLKQLTEEPPVKPRALVKSVPRDLETICLKCLDKNPNSRYESAEAVAQDLERWLQKRPVHARRVSPIVVFSRWCRCNPVGTALMLLVCSALASALTVLRSQRQEYAAHIIREYLNDEKAAEIEKVWRDPEEDSVLFRSPYLATLRGEPLAALSARNAMRLTLAWEMGGDPLARAEAAAPVLRHIEKQMEKALHQRVVFDLILQKHRPDVGDPLIKGTGDFQRLGPLAYIRAKEASPGIQLLASEKSSDQGVIFARKDLGVTNLAGLRGLRVALAHTNSIVSFWAEVEMARAGIAATNLRAYEHLNPPRVMVGTNELTWNDAQFAHKVVMDGVISNRFDVGECRRYDLERSPASGHLVELTRFSVSPKVYVARAGLSTNVSRAFQDALLSFGASAEETMLKRLFDGDFIGFQKATDQNLNDIRSALTNEIRRFEGRD